jgi:dipeptidyl aminopeptidase/acylaminoacyl peptidase
VSISRDGRRVAFVERIARRNIQKVAFDPTAERIMGQPVWITRGSRQDNWPDPSPDGAWVAFASIGAPQEDLAVIRTDGTGERRITNDAARDRVPRWSPDGKRIMFYSNRLTERWQVWAINPDGSGLQKLGETEQSVQWPTWSPDGRRVAYGWVGSSACCISELGKPWKDHTERLPELSEAESFALSAWSPDGKWLCGGVIGRRSSASTVTGVSGTAVYSFETRRFEKLTNFGGAPIWLSDSRRLLFPHGQGIYLVDRASRKVRQITLENPYPIFPAGFRVSKDDRTIYYAVDINEADIWLMTLQ